MIVFSGTNNTLLVAEMLRDNFRKRGVSADILDITGEGRFVIDEYEVIGLGYPIYAFNTPLIFLRYIKKLGLRNKRLFIFKTSGEPCFLNNPSSLSLIRLLPGCTILGEYHFLMPYNIMFRFPDNLMKQMYRHARRYSEYATANIIAGKVSRISYNLFSRFIAFIFTIQRPGAAINGRLYRIKRDHCNFCLRCLRNCPGGNIRIQKTRGGGQKLSFGFSCQMCMRCSFNCPRDAIVIGLLKGWKVSGPFRFEELERDKSLDGRFIHEHSRGFYRLYIPYFKTQERLGDGSFP